MLSEHNITMVQPFRLLAVFASLIILIEVLLGCGQQGSSPFSPNVYTATHNWLYVATGSCYGGGVAVPAGPSNLISKVDMDTGQVQSVVIDYNQYNPGDSPIAMAEYDANHLLVLVENLSGRHIDLVNKDGSGATIYLSNSTALNAVSRAMLFLPDSSILVSKSNGVEKFSSGKSRVTIGVNPWIYNPAGSCATSTTLISSIGVYPNGKTLYAHAAASPNNKLGLISSTGYASSADCLAASAAPTTTALPTKILVHSSGDTLVSYGSTTAASNFIYSYNVNSLTNTITSPAPAWTDYTIVNGPTTMTEDPSTGNVFVANGTSTFQTIEQFSYDSTSKTLTRIGATPFMPASIYTRCVTDMQVLP